MLGWSLLWSSTVAGGGGGMQSESSMPTKEALAWGLQKIEAPQAWETTQGSHEIVVAVIDSGIDRNHPSLNERMWVNSAEIPSNQIDDDHNGFVDDIHGWDFRDRDADVLDGSPIHAHGTMIAGVIAANADASGMVGVAPQIRLMDLRILNSKNQFLKADWPRFAEAIRYALNNGADVINLSVYSKQTPSEEFHQAIQEAVAQGVTVVGIAGNQTSHVQYPGKYEEIIAVAATDSNDRAAYFSNFGPEVDIVAPGVDIPTLLLNGRKGMVSGTSFSAAHVSGVIALMLSVDPTLTVSHIRELLSDVAQDLGQPGHDARYGNGRINAAALIEQLN